MTPPIIYNLFQPLVGSTTHWSEHARRARDMHFDWLYLNPWHYPGFSGSLYAPKELWRINPLFLPPGSDDHSLEPLRRFLAEMRAIEMPVIMDLIVNHTSKDSPLTRQHPSWFVRDAHGELVSPTITDPDDPDQVTVWGDLAEIDTVSSTDLQGLYEFLAELVRESVRLGFKGFRCDAAYKAPAALWSHLIRQARSVDPEVTFFAETLGAPVENVLALHDAGFDYFFNSSKWWDFSAPWALEQHERFGRIAPSISFPETHDTTRLAADTGGDETVQRQRYAFAAAFSAGLMMPIGYEFGFQKRLNVASTTPSDWEPTRFDIQPFVARVNRLKRAHASLQEEGRLAARTGAHENVLVLERRVERQPRPAYIVLNKRQDSSIEIELERLVGAAADGHHLFRVMRDDEGPPGSMPRKLPLERAEVVYLLPPEVTGH